MRRRWAIIILLSLGIAGLSAACADDVESDAASGAGSSPPCEREDPFAAATLRADVGFLAAEERGGRFPGTEGDRAARQHVEDRFRCLGLEPGGIDGSYQQPFVTSEGDPTANVIGVIPGRDTEVGREIVVVGAHHDHIGREGGRLHSGANDNASGTAALMALAAAMRELDAAPRRTVVFAAFGGEETLKSAPYLEGSVRFVRHPPPGMSIDDVVYMVNLDMLGTYSETGAAHAFGAGRGTPARAAIRELRPDFPGLSVRAGGTAGKYESDFYSFVRAGIPYVFMHTPDPRCLHEPCDEPGRLDYGRIKTPGVQVQRDWHNRRSAVRLRCWRAPHARSMAPGETRHWMSHQP